MKSTLVVAIAAVAVVLVAQPFPPPLAANSSELRRDLAEARSAKAGRAATAATAQAPRGAVSPLPSFAEPGISPDGSTIAFVSGGDIWEAPARGGDAHLLVSHPANEQRPLYSPDGSRIAFTSTRTGNGDVYVLALTSGEVTRLTFDD